MPALRESLPELYSIPEHLSPCVFHVYSSPDRRKSLLAKRSLSVLLQQRDQRSVSVCLSLENDTLLQRVLTRCYEAKGLKQVSALIRICQIQLQR